MGTAILSTKFELRKIGWALGMYYGLAYIGNIIGPIFITLLAILFTWRIFAYSVLIAFPDCRDNNIHIFEW
jgi:hypothetical protein